MQVAGSLEPLASRILSADAEWRASLRGALVITCPEAAALAGTLHRALAYRINRQAVLDGLLRGEIRQPVVRSFMALPVGQPAENALDYASDPATKPWPCDTAAGRGRGRASRSGPRQARTNGGGTAVAVLVLAFPPVKSRNRVRSDPGAGQHGRASPVEGAFAVPGPDPRGGAQSASTWTWPFGNRWSTGALLGEDQQ